MNYYHSDLLNEHNLDDELSRSAKEGRMKTFIYLPPEHVATLFQGTANKKIYIKQKIPLSPRWLSIDKKSCMNAFPEGLCKAPVTGILERKMHAAYFLFS